MCSRETFWAGDVSAQIPQSVPRTEDELDSETRSRYADARENLRQAEREYEQALRDADAADPALALARELEGKAREAQAKGQIHPEYQYEQRGSRELQKFNDWDKCYRRQIANARMKELAALGAGGRSLSIWYAKLILSATARERSRLPENLQAVLPEKPDELSDDDVLTAMRQYCEAAGGAADCTKLEPALSPSPQIREDVERSAQADFDLSVCAEYVSGMTPESVRMALKRTKEATNEVNAVWPYWSEYELALARQKHLASGPPPRETQLRQTNRVWLLILGNALVVLILGALWWMRHLKSRS